MGSRGAGVSAKQLIVVLIHDRPELAKKVIEAIRQHTTDSGRVVYALDAPTFDLSGMDLWHEEHVQSKENVGAAEMLNLALRHFWEGEDLIRVDSDTRPLQAGWNGALASIMHRRHLDVASPVWPDGEPPTKSRVLCSGILATSGEMVAKLGAWHGYGTYAYEDLDWQRRAEYAGGKLGYVREVKVENLDPRGYVADWKQRAYRHQRKNWFEQASKYMLGKEIYQPLGDRS